jgi:hypothetical protein
MTEVESVALWVGIIVGIGGTVLAGVAIWFASRVDARAATVNDQTIRSLMKIETTVLRLSEDTTGLIKGAWDKLIGQVGEPASAENRKAAEEVVSGISAEIQAEMATSGEGANEVARKLTAVLEDIKATLAGQMAVGRPEKLADKIERFLAVLGEMSHEARQLAKSISDRHLTRQQYRNVMQSPLRQALRELRVGGILVPLSGEVPPHENPVYYYPPGETPAILAALSLLSEPPPEVKSRVLEVLRKVGYYRETAEDEGLGRPRETP